MPTLNGPRAEHDFDTGEWHPIREWGPRWLRATVWRWRHRDAHLGWACHREYGGWTVRPGRGWRRLRWITPPLHFTRSIPASQPDRALDWGMARMGL
ncbi:hypothetical protein NDR87_31055 [Nocardia sp. CDC159]|uniref:Uncharacterized protein n=1 Tax=Nocardia pulmonis TaxID=2951408 RepID=A0A9X2ECT3_9NOCA|nr:MULTISPECIES: hypothetical protein [Nocardia]MCM6778010.1 hypothetical protein [Nocardia pulmonis]MCM6790819.1 hypothetical protein [Nocardia sp. CDC159]